MKIIKAKGMQDKGQHIAILRMQLQAFASGCPELACKGELMIPDTDLDRIVPYRDAGSL